MTYYLKVPHVEPNGISPFSTFSNTLSVTTLNRLQEVLQTFSKALINKNFELSSYTPCTLYSKGPTVVLHYNIMQEVRSLVDSHNIISTVLHK